MAGVTFRGVEKRYGKVPVIANLDLEIRDRELMVLVGPSGCGKSTALRMVAGLEELSSGTITIGNRVVNDLPPKDRDVAMVFQSYALYPHMTVRENLEFGLRIRRTPDDERRRRVAEVAETLGISELLDRKPKELSGGQRQRVAVGRAIVRKPAVFLFDEPLSNLDAKLRTQMRAEITKLQRRLQTTTIYVTHDQVEAMTMGDRIAVMSAGAVMQVGTPLECYERPANLFVASFIGTPPMNLVAATIDEGGSRLAAERFSLAVPERSLAATRGGDGRRIVVGIRPEALSDAERSGAAARISGPVEIVEPLGHQVIVHVRVGADLLAATLPPANAPAIGTTLELGVGVDALHLFDAETGQRLGG